MYKSLTKYKKLFKLNNINEFKYSTELISKIKNENSELFQKKKIHPFKNLYNWKTLDDFATNLENNIVYNDGTLIAIDKPWGLGFHSSYKNLHGPYSYESLSKIEGDIKFCMNDSLDILQEKLKLKDKLIYVKTIDRFSSGLVLLATNEKTKQQVFKSFRSNKAARTPYFSFMCITQGYPAIIGNEITEKVKIKLVNVGDDPEFKEPQIFSDKHFDIKNNGYKALVNLKIEKINKKNSASYLRITTDRLRWNFVRCYAANKSSFILGDLRFSANIKKILGQQVKETTNDFYNKKILKTSQPEPLNEEIKKALKVSKNSQIPILLHLDSITLKSYKKKDLIIKSKKLPEYFEFSLKNLELI